MKLHNHLRRLLTDERGFIGTTAAIVASALAAGGHVAGAAIAAHAAKGAAATQQLATNQALAQQQQMYQTQQQQFQPYRQLGDLSLQRLQSMGPVTNARPGASWQGGPGMAAPMPNPSGQPGSIPVGSGQTPLAAMNGQPSPGGLVLMRAPNGTTKAVPRELVQHYTQQGASVVSQ